MSENWQIALMTAFMAAGVAMLTSIAATLSGMRRDLSGKVDRKECDRSMDTHCERLNSLDRDVRKNVSDIAVLQAQVEALTGTHSRIVT